MPRTTTLALVAACASALKLTPIPSVSRRDAAAAVAAAAIAAVPFAPLAAGAVGTCPPNAQNCWSSASSDKTKVPAWTSGKSQKDAAADVKAVIDAYPQAGQEKVDLGGWSYTEDAILTSGKAKLEFKSGIGNFAKFLNGGKPFVDDLELQLSDGGLAVKSASRVGDSDLGVNAKRLNYIAAKLREKGWTAPGV